ncbi:MAG TPA: SRPBCC family protein [Terriglobales bacterium]|nr:SRPBCC family protein [Terriglobales bacterium]
MSTSDEMGMIVDGGSVQFVRVLPAPVARIWWFLSERDGMAAWLTDGEVEPRPGGRLELVWETGEVQRGEVTRWEPERVLEYTWDAGGERSVVRYELTPQGGQTMLVLTHTRLETDRLAGYAAGWDAHLHMLAAACEGASREFQETFDRMLPLYRERVATWSGTL